MTEQLRPDPLPATAVSASAVLMPKVDRTCPGMMTDSSPALIDWLRRACHVERHRHPDDGRRLNIHPLTSTTQRTVHTTRDRRFPPPPPSPHQPAQQPSSREATKPVHPAADPRLEGAQPQ